MSLAIALAMVLGVMALPRAAVPQTPDSSSAKEQRIAVSEEPVCVQCAINVQEIAILGDEQGPGTIDTEDTLGIRASDGRYYVHSFATRGGVPIKVFAEDGTFIEPLGEFGEGPGEFGNVAAVRELEDGYLAVFDSIPPRMTVLSPTHELVDTVRWQILPTFTVEALANGESLLASDSRLPNQIGLPLHVVGADGTVVRSFGAEDDSFYPGSRSVERRIALSKDGGVWATSPWEYVVEHWSLDGELLASLSRPNVYTGPRNEDPSAPQPSIAALREDDDGLLWVYILVADARWREQLGRPIGRPGQHGGEADFVGTKHEYRDTIVEVIDPKTGDLLARTRLDARAFPMADRVAGAAIPAGERFDLRFTVWALELVGRR